MKTPLLLLAVTIICFPSAAQQSKDLEARIRAIEDKTALKTLVDTFSILADQKETQKQTLLFTTNAVVETYMNGQKVASLAGRKQIGDAFAGFLKNFETVYHMNGQQTVTVNGDKASGISYCSVTLISAENGKKTKTSFGVYYNDEFVRENNQWLIQKRTSTFAWQDRQPLGN